MIKFNKYYFLLALLLFAIELYIGLYMHDNFVRPYGGDFLVVILLFCLIKSFVDWPVIPTAAGVLVFAYLVEISQYFHLVTLLGLQHSKTARLLLGTSFSFTDLLCYTLGIATVVFVGNIRLSMKNF